MKKFKLMRKYDNHASWKKKQNTTQIIKSNVK